MRAEAAYYILHLPLVAFSVSEHIPLGRQYGWRTVDIAACSSVLIAGVVALVAQWKAIIYDRWPQSSGASAGIVQKLGLFRNPQVQHNTGINMNSAIHAGGVTGPCMQEFNDRWLVLRVSQWLFTNQPQLIPRSTTPCASSSCGHGRPTVDHLDTCHVRYYHQCQGGRWASRG
jgi:hypothetical protein